MPLIRSEMQIPIRYEDGEGGTFRRKISGLAAYFLNAVRIADLSAPLALSAGANTITGGGTGTLSGIINNNATVYSSAEFASTTQPVFTPATVAGSLALLTAGSFTPGVTSGGFTTVGLAYSIQRFTNNGTTVSFQLQVVDGLYVKGHIFSVTQSGANLVINKSGTYYISGTTLGVDVTTGTLQTTVGAYGCSGFKITANVASSLTINVDATATLTVSGNNTYTGGTTINNGTVKATHGNALGASGAIALQGGTLDISALTYAEQEAIVARTTISGGGTLKRVALPTDYTRVFDYSADGLTAGALTTWSDLSGNNRTLTGSGGVNVGELSGRKVVTSDGNAPSNSRARFVAADTANAPVTSQRWVIVALSKWDASGSPFGRLLSINNDTASGEWLRNNSLYINRDNLTTTLKVGNANAIPLTVSNYVDGVMHSHRFTCAAGVLKVWRDGSQQGTTGLMDNSGSVKLGVITLFDDSATDTTNGNGVHSMRRVMLIDVGNGGDPEAVGTQVEAVLLWRDGMQASLPANHTYKNAPPVATVTAGGVVVN